MRDAMPEHLPPTSARRTELLAHPISQQRFAAIAGALELWSAFPLPGGTFLARGAGGLRDAHRECTAVLHLHQIGCILVPTLVAALLVRRSPWAVERSADVAEEQQTGWQRACAALQRRLAWAGEELQATIAGAHPLQQALIWWLALGSLWTLAQVIDS